LKKILHEFFEYNPREIGSAFHPDETEERFHRASRAGAEIEQKFSVIYRH
jgi:hypothetical protein